MIRWATISLSNIDVKACRLCWVIVFAAVLGGCAGQRESYRSLLSGGPPAINVAVGDEKELLVVANGFPGWWGYYPAIWSLDESVASVVCSSARSSVPFRKPGMILGGERCYLVAHNIGETWLMKGNKFAVDETRQETPGYDDSWIRLRVESEQVSPR